MDERRTTIVRRDERGHWLPGASANPFGKPAVVREWREKCRSFMAGEGWEELQSIAKDTENRHQMDALRLIAGYAYGLPMQRIQVDDDGARSLIADLTSLMAEELANRDRAHRGNVVDAVIIQGLPAAATATETETETETATPSGLDAEGA